MSCSKHSQNQAEQQSPPSAPLPVISVDGFIIEEKALASELQYHQNKNFDVVVQEAGQSLVIRQLFTNHAKNNGIKVTKANEEEVLQQIISDNVTYSDPTNEDCARYFENNQAKFATLPLMEVDHILLAAAKDDFPGREVAKNNAKDIITKLKNDPMLFPALANEYSACPSKKMGGSLGQLSKGQTVPEFERQLMPLGQGLSDKPIESRYGYHVVNITRKIDGKPLEYSMVEDKVRGYLIHRASHLAIQAFIQSLIEKAEITGITMKFREENIHI
ncbi:MAG: peptidylprolyl isomerase [Gammaproteobacteria bacterium]|nr:MAG: peptidylprolyl isomerase [Gammaproteobacteria bacterium]